MLSIVLTLSGGAVMEKTLDNGLKIIAVQKDKLPIFQLSLHIYAGSINDPEGKDGLASFTGNLIDEGTKHYSKLDITNKFDELGTRFGISVSKVGMDLNLKALTPNADASLEILADIVKNPAFPQDEFEKMQKRLISNILSDKGDPNYVAGILASRLFYGDHPLAHPVEGDEKTIANITLDDIKAFYDKYYVPGNAFIVVVSNLKPEETIALVEKHFADWKKKEVPQQKFPYVKYPDKRKAYVYHMPGLNQAFVFLLGKGIARNNPDYNKARVANYILGGSGFSSRILQTIRVKHGYAYWAYSYFNGGYRLPDHPEPGAFMAGFASKTESSNHALQLLIEEIEKARKEGFTKKELEDAKSYYEGSIARQGQSYSQLAGFYSTAVIWGLPYDFWKRDIEEIKKLTLKDVNEAARKYFPDRFIVLVLTDTSRFKLEVEGFDEVEYRDYK